MSKQGLLLVVSGPSGCGKGTVCKEIRRRNPEIRVSVSATTRFPRTGETHGVDYFFVSDDQFQEMIDTNSLLEYAKIYSGRSYGTPKKYVMDMLDNGHDVILEIDMQGALQVKKQYDEAILIFLIPPTLTELRNRLVGRGTEKEEVINERFNSAKNELSYINQYNYVVLNDDVNKAADKIQAIISAEKCVAKRNLYVLQTLLEGGSII